MADDLARLADEIAVCNVRRHRTFRLDPHELEALRECFHPGAAVTVSWFSGSIETFIERTKGLFAARKPKENRKHWLGDAPCDRTSYARFCDLMEKCDRIWRIGEWQTIYDRDRVDPVVPAAEPAPFYSQATFKGAGLGFAFMKLCQAVKVRTVPDTLVIAGTESEGKLRQRGADWLAGAQA